MLFNTNQQTRGFLVFILISPINGLEALVLLCSHIIMITANCYSFYRPQM